MSGIFNIIIDVLFTTYLGFLCVFLSKNTIFSLFCILITIYLAARIYLRKKDNYFLEDESNIYELIHDIKTPAIASLRATELLLKGAFGYINENQKEVITELNNSSKFMMNIINNITTLCAFEHDNINWHYESFDINQLVKMCINNLKYLAKDKRCTILFDYSEEEIFVFASKTEITRVLLNLLTNAVKYSYPDRIITTITKIEKGKCVFSVNSYGENLDKNTIKNIFKKYTTLHKTGNGLGLYISNLILEKHNCKMTVTSDCKLGNNFSFKLQLAQKQESALKAKKN